jgi:chromosome partitioning protein
MQRIVVLNPKGGSGKTTIAINLAAYLATRGHTPVLMDHDPQGSSSRWVRKRKPPQPAIHAIAAYERDTRTTRSFQLRVPSECSHLVIDTPAALDSRTLAEMTRDADKVIVPVLPSDIDINACSNCVRDLLLVAKIKRDENRIGVIANRIRRNTLTYQSLIRFLHTLGIPIVATIRDSQNYVRAAELGVGVHEMKSYVAHDDVEQWLPLTDWLSQPRRQHVPGSHAVHHSAPLAAAQPSATEPAPLQAAAAVHAGVGMKSVTAPQPGVTGEEEETTPLPAAAGI